MAQRPADRLLVSSNNMNGTSPSKSVTPVTHCKFCSVSSQQWPRGTILSLGACSTRLQGSAVEVTVTGQGQCWGW